METIDLSALSLDAQLSHEWLAVNGLGGYAASTLPGCNTRKYHGLLVAAMSPPVRGMVLLSRVEETVFHDGWPHPLACNEYPETMHPQGHRLLRAFSNDPYPRWGYQNDGWTIEKSLRLLKGENTVVLSYTLMGAAKPVEFEVRPLFALRGMHELMYQWNAPLAPANVTDTHHHIKATHATPEVFFAHDGTFTGEGYWYLNTIYRREQERGYSGLEDLWSPGVVRFTLAPGQTVNFACSTDPIDLPRALSTADAQYDAARAAAAVDGARPDANLEALCRAADQFVVQTRDGRAMLTSGYPWSAPSGRDAMINLPGLLLATGKLSTARNVLEHFATLERDGLMPSEFPTDGSAAKYRGADVSLWFVNALHQYLRYAHDERTAQQMFDVVDRIVAACERGTALGLRADADGLLASGAPAVPATWMNAEVEDAPVTPRNGRAVEVNALWYNALRIAADLAKRAHHPVRGEELNTLANKVKLAFNRRFWKDAAGCCHDVVTDNGVDPSVRPNQLLAMSLPYPVLSPDRWDAVLTKLRDELLTPTGLRTLSPTDRNYKGRYGGTVVARDRAYHQGCAYPWLLGPFVTAFVRAYGGKSPGVRDRAANLLAPTLKHLTEAGGGQLPELFDGDAPHHPGGLTASARSVAETLRAYAEDVLDLAPVDPARQYQPPPVVPAHAG